MNTLYQLTGQDYPTITTARVQTSNTLKNHDNSNSKLEQVVVALLEEIIAPLQEAPTTATGILMMGVTAAPTPPTGKRTGGIILLWT